MQEVINMKIKMKEINRIIKMLFLGCAVFFIFSCKTASIVNFESENFERFKNQSDSQNYPDTFYFARVMTASCVDLIFFRFSRDGDCSDILVKNIAVYDDKNVKLFEKEILKITSNGFVHKEKDVDYEIYSYEMPREEFDRTTLKNCKTDYIILNFEIGGIKYSEKLNRVEKKYLLTRS